MIEIGVIIVLAALLGWKEYSSRKERENLLDALISKDAADMANLKIARKVKPPRDPELPPDLMAVEDMDPDSKEFMNILESDNG